MTTERQRADVARPGEPRERWFVGRSAQGLPIITPTAEHVADCASAHESRVEALRAFCAIDGARP